MCIRDSAQGGSGIAEFALVLAQVAFQFIQPLGLGQAGEDVYKRQVLHHAEGVDLIPANIELAGLEVALVNTMSREKMLKQVLDSAKQDYDYILLDCTPSLGMLTINALAAADTALILSLIHISFWVENTGPILITVTLLQSMHGALLGELSPCLLYTSTVETGGNVFRANVLLNL